MPGHALTGTSCGPFTVAIEVYATAKPVSRVALGAHLRPGLRSRRQEPETRGDEGTAETGTPVVPACDRRFCAVTGAHPPRGGHRGLARRQPGTRARAIRQPLHLGPISATAPALSG